MPRFALVPALAALLAAAPLAAEPPARIDVMSQNQYLGADLGPVIAAPDAASFNAALVAALQQIAANALPERAGGLADLVALRRPHLVGQQEVFRFACTNIPLPGPDCSEPSVAGAFNDHLDAVLDALAARGRPYEVAAVVENLNLTGVIVPGLPPGVPVDLNFDTRPDIAVTVLDRDVILARPDVPTDVVVFPCANPSADGCNFSTVAQVVSPIGPLDVERGFAGVDAEVGGRHYRFVNTHLEVMGPVPAPPGTPPGVVPGGSIQAAQATELNALIAASLLVDPPPPGSQPILVGDINSSPGDGLFVDPLFPVPGQLLVPPYLQFVGALDLTGGAAPGPWTDAWTRLPFPRSGFTCCQDSDLANRRSQLDERIDVIFSLAEPRAARRGRVLGSTPRSKTRPSRLWPSDHGQPAIELRFD